MNGGSLAFAGITLVAALLTAGCGAASRHETLSYFFDGVPPPKAATVPAPGQPAGTEGAAPPRSIGYREHGPYAARLCNACHESAATNALVAPPDQLCFKCHDLQMGRKYVHGPLASGGCLVCHDPHSSQYRYLLVSESDGFCFHCHDRAAVQGVPAHQGAGEQCTACHDAHMSDRKFLLK